MQAGVHSFLNLEDRDALKLDTVHTGPEKVSILVAILSVLSGSLLLKI